MQQLTASDISQYQKTTAEVQHGPHSLVSTILNLVPSNVFAAIAHGDILPIIFFSVLFGLALSSLPAGHRYPLVQTFRSIAVTMFRLTNMVLPSAPVGVAALIAGTVPHFGSSFLLLAATLVVLVSLAV